MAPTYYGYMPRAGSQGKFPPQAAAHHRARPSGLAFSVGGAMIHVFQRPNNESRRKEVAMLGKCKTMPPNSLLCIISGAAFVLAAAGCGGSTPAPVSKAPPTPTTTTDTKLADSAVTQ